MSSPPTMIVALNFRATRVFVSSNSCSTCFLYAPTFMESLQDNTRIKVVEHMVVFVRFFLRRSLSQCKIIVIQEGEHWLDILRQVKNKQQNEGSLPPEPMCLYRETECVHRGCNTWVKVISTMDWQNVQIGSDHYIACNFGRALNSFETMSLLRQDTMFENSVCRPKWCSVSRGMGSVLSSSKTFPLTLENRVIATSPEVRTTLLADRMASDKPKWVTMLSEGQLFLKPHHVASRVHRDTFTVWNGIHYGRVETKVTINHSTCIPVENLGPFRMRTEA